MALTSSSVKMQVRSGAERLAYASREPQRDAALLLCRVLGKDRAWMLAHPDVPLSAVQINAYQALVARRTQHEPMQYILGEQEFYGLRFAVSPAVLIPRPETELLVETALELLPTTKQARIADVGTGSGAIAVALAHARPLLHVTALDLSQSALQVALANAEAHGVAARVRSVASDLLAAVGDERFDMIVSNPPYVPAGEVLEPQVAHWEPAEALYAGPRGLDVYERLIPAARATLEPGGWLLLEIGHGQQEAVATLLAGWRDVRFLDDLQRIARVAVARKGSHDAALTIPSPK